MATSPKPTKRLSWISPCGAINAPQNRSTNPPIESTAAVINWMLAFIGYLLSLRTRVLRIPLQTTDVPVIGLQRLLAPRVVTLSQEVNLVLGESRHILATIIDESRDALIDWPSIYQTIDLVYDGFYTRLVQKYGANDQSNGSAHPVLNEKELQLCCLLKADFSTKEINMLTRQSLQTIYQRKTQVRQKLSLAEAEDITTAII